MIKILGNSLKYRLNNINRKGRYRIIRVGSRDKKNQSLLMLMLTLVMRMRMRMRMGWILDVNVGMLMLMGRRVGLNLIGRCIGMFKE